MVSDNIFSCSHSPGSTGQVDESNRRFLAKERAVAEGLAREGHDVAAHREGPQIGKQADANVCGQATEFKRLQPEGTAEPENRVRNILDRSSGQGTHVIVDTSADQRVTAEKADEGVRKFLALEASKRAEGKLEGTEKLGIRVVGANFDLSYDKSRLDQIRQEQTRAHRRDSDTSVTTPETSPSRPQNRFALSNHEERSAGGDRAANRFQITKGDEGSGRRRGPTK